MHPRGSTAVQNRNLSPIAVLCSTAADSSSPLFSVLLPSLAMASFSSACSLLSSSFVSKERDDGERFYCLSDSAPEWCSTAVMLAHDDELPNDSRYALIRDAAIALSDQQCDSAEDAQEALWELSCDLLPSSTAALLQWFADRPSRLSDCDDALEELGSSGSYGSASDLLELGHRRASEAVLSVLIAEIEENRESMFNPEEDARLLLSDSHGIYIPQLYCQTLSEEEAEESGISWEDVLLCQQGPEEELYWEAWQQICDAAEWEEDGEMWRLLQNGDLWQVRADAVIPQGWL